MNTGLSNTPPDVSADDLRFLAASLRGWTMEVLDDIERRYNPHQPRVPAVQATRAAVALGQTTLREAAGMVSALRARLNGTRAAEESNAKIRRAADAVEDFLGGKPDRVILNKDRDLTIMKGNKKFRMDINNPNFKPDRVTPDDPHFHLQEYRNGKWRDATQDHRLYFKKEP